jgi:uncharacterized protein (DUF983 family)
MPAPIPPLKTLLLRGWRRKCPHCGHGNLFRRWNTLNENCAACGLKLLENQGDLWGYILFADRALFILPLIVMIYFRLYIPDSNWFYIIGAIMVAGLIYTLPHRTGACLALDYLIRRKSGDLADKDDNEAGKS